MNDIDDPYAGFAVVTRALRRGQVSRGELVERALERISVLNPVLNAIVTLDPEGCRERARAADRSAASGKPWATLDGLVTTVKDSFETQGIRTTAAAPELRDHVPAANAPAVQRLLDHGAILLGKTNLPKYAGDLQTNSRLLGRTNNPWRLARTPGGSSGGGAAAVAAGLSLVDLASDHAGSVRIPAAYCGIYGHRPTAGLVPVRGHVPPAPGARLPRDLTAVGLLARHPDDIATTLGRLAGPEEPATRAWRLELPPASDRPLRDYRVAVWEDDALPVDRDVAHAVTTFLDTLADHCVAVTPPVSRVDSAAVAALFDRLLGATVAPLLDDERFQDAVAFAAAPPGDDSSYGRDARAVAQTHRAWLQAQEERARLSDRVDAWLEGVDVLVGPVTPTTAPEHDDTPDRHARRIVVDGERRPYFDQFAWIALATVLGLPSTVVPIALGPDRLPVAVQVIGRPYDDLTTLAFAQRLHDEGLTLTERPPVEGLPQ